VVLLILIILVAAAITGSLGAVLEVAAGVALGLFLFVVALGLAGYYFARYKLRQSGRRYQEYRRSHPERFRDGY
jgi:Kef-type K+ transport system membrane component KefB